jgi:hypothetical protein
MKNLFNIMFSDLKGMSKKDIAKVVYLAFTFILLCGEPVGWKPFLIYYAIVLANFGYACHLVKTIDLKDDEEDEDPED